jgi:hypothetical protein
MPSLRIPFLVVAFVLVADAACAGTAKPAPAAAGTYGTRDQLRECLDLDDSLKQRTRGIEAATTANNQHFDANEAEAVKLVDTKKALDRSDKAAILAFNQLVVDHNQHVQKAQQEQADIELATGVLATDRAGADHKCGALTYRPADMDAVTRERKKAALSAAAASAP